MEQTFSISCKDKKLNENPKVKAWLKEVNKKIAQETEKKYHEV